MSGFNSTHSFRHPFDRGCDVFSISCPQLTWVLPSQAARSIKHKGTSIDSHEPSRRDRLQISYEIRVVERALSFVVGEEAPGMMQKLSLIRILLHWKQKEKGIHKKRQIQGRHLNFKILKFVNYGGIKIILFSFMGPAQGYLNTFKIKCLVILIDIDSHLNNSQSLSLYICIILWSITMPNLWKKGLFTFNILLNLLSLVQCL